MFQGAAEPAGRALCPGVSRVQSASLGCRGDTPPPQLGQGNKGDMETGAGHESAALHFLKTGFRPFTEELILSLCSTQRDRKLQRKKGASVSYMVAQGAWGRRGCWQGAGLAPGLKGEPLAPFDCFQKRSPGSRGKLFFLGN